MGIGYFKTAALAVAYILALGQAPLSAQTSSQQQIRPQLGLEQSLAAQQEPLHSRLVRMITSLEQELFPEAQIGEDVCEEVGKRVYGAITALANKFNRSVNLDSLCVYTFNDDIVIENRRDLGLGTKLWTYRLIIYQDNMALEAVDYGFSVETQKISIAKSNGKEVIVEGPREIDNHFAHVPDMNEYDFSRLYQRVTDLNKGFKGLRKAEPNVRKDHAAEWYYSHPVDSPKYWYVKDQLKFIANGLFERFDMHIGIGHFGYSDRYDGNIGGYSTVNTNRGFIRVYSDEGYSQQREGNITIILVVGNRPEARVTTVIERRDQPSESEFETVLPIKK